MFTLFVLIHIVVCALLIIVVLLQSGKGEGLAGAFGGGSMGAVFGGRGTATFLTRATTVLAIAFMVNCLVLTLLSIGRKGGPQSVLQQMNQSQQTAPPVATPRVADTTAQQNPFGGQ